MSDFSRMFHSVIGALSASNDHHAIVAANASGINPETSLQLEELRNTKAAAIDDLSAQVDSLTDTVLNTSKDAIEAAVMAALPGYVSPFVMPLVRKALDDGMATIEPMIDAKINSTVAALEARVAQLEGKAASVTPPPGNATFQTTGTVDTTSGASHTGA